MTGAQTRHQFAETTSDQQAKGQIQDLDGFKPNRYIETAKPWLCPEPPATNANEAPARLPPARGRSEICRE